MLPESISSGHGLCWDLVCSGQSHRSLGNPNIYVLIFILSLHVRVALIANSRMKVKVETKMTDDENLKFEGVMSSCLYSIRFNFQRCTTASAEILLTALRCTPFWFALVSIPQRIWSWTEQDQLLTSNHVCNLRYTWFLGSRRFSEGASLGLEQNLRLWYRGLCLRMLPLSPDSSQRYRNIVLYCYQSPWKCCADKFKK